MKTKWKIANLFVIVLITVFPARDLIASEIGVYFDEGAMINCLPDSSNYPIPIHAYIVLTDLGPGGSVAGWEAAISGSESLTLIQGQIFGEHLNVGTFPDYVVGLSETAYCDSSIVLASFLVSATGPGEIFLTGPGNSVPNGWPAVLLESGGAIVRPDYAYGGINQMVASIGKSDCPVLNVPEEPLNGVQEFQPEYSLYATRKVTTYVEENKSLSFSPPTADVWLIGRVISKELQCVSGDMVDDSLKNFIPSGQAGAAKIKFEIIETIVGDVADTISAFVPGYSIDGCVNYENFDFLPDPDELNVGSEFFVAGDFMRDGLWVKDYGLVPWSNDKAQNEFIQISNFAFILEEGQQNTEADVIGDFLFEGWYSGGARFSVVRIIRGRVEATFIVDVIPSSQKIGGINFGKNMKIGRVYRSYLKTSNGKIVPVNGLASFNEIRRK